MFRTLDAETEAEPKESFIPPGPMWRTRDGEKIPVEQMTYAHLCNAINLLESRLGENPSAPGADILAQWLGLLIFERDKRPESLVTAVIEVPGKGRFEV